MSQTTRMVRVCRMVDLQNANQRLTQLNSNVFKDGDLPVLGLMIETSICLFC